VLLQDVQGVGQAIAALKQARRERDYLIADTPGSFMQVITSAIGSGDCIVLPVRASPLDILAQEDVAAMAQKAGKAGRCMFVLNCCDGRAKANLDDAVERLAGLFPNPIVRIAQRQDYARSLIEGKTGPELNKAAADETAGLWAAISAILRKGSRK
jgi:chromosome partitioning protein